MNEPNQKESAPEAQAEPQTQESTSKPDSEAAYWRRQAAKYEKQAKEFEKASLSEAERYKLERDAALQENANYRTQLSDTAKRQAFEKVAKAAGVIDPDAAFVLAKQGAELTLTDGGKLLGADKAIQELKTLRPYLFEGGGKLGVSGGITRGTEVKQSPDQHVNNFLRST